MSSRHSSSVGSGTGILSVPQVNAMTASSPYKSEVLISRKGTPSYSGEGSKCPSIPSLHPVVGTTDDRGHPDLSEAVNASGRGGTVLRPAAATAAAEPASPRVSSLRAGWRWLRSAHDRLNDSLLGDAIGAACVWLIFLIFLFATA